MTTALSLGQARRIAVHAQALDGSGRDVLEVVRRIGFLQLDPTARVAPTQLLVLWSRLGRYDPAELERLLWVERKLFEWNAFVYPVEELPALKARMRDWPRGDGSWRERARAWLRANEKFRRHVLRELAHGGPLPSRAIEDRVDVPWPSSGWTNERNVTQMLEFLNARGEVAIAGRAGRQRLWDLPERVYPDVEALPEDEAEAYLAARRLRSLGIARKGPGRRVEVGDTGTWFLDRDANDAPVPRRTTFLSPFDRLIHDRERTEHLFGFRYRLEMYVPKDKREYGFFVLPTLRSDRLVGRIDPELDRKTRVLRVNGVWWEPRVRPVSLDAPLRSLARFLGAEAVES